MLIIIDEVPLSKNQYLDMGCRKFKARLAKRKEYKIRIGWLIQEQKSFEKLIKPDVYAELPYAKAKITFDIFFKNKRRRDAQNYEGGGLISFLDCLVDLGFIEDDSYDCIGQPQITFSIDKEFPRCEIRIEKEIK